MQEDRTVDGDVLAVLLIWSLILFMLATFYVVFVALRPEDRVVLLAPFLRLSHSALFAVGALASFFAYRSHWRRWWTFAAIGIVPVLQLSVPFVYMRSKRRLEATA